MKKLIAVGMLLSTALPNIAAAAPFDHRPDGPGDRPPVHHQGSEHGGSLHGPHHEGRAPEHEPRLEPPHHSVGLRHSMPRDAEALLIGGMTYYVLNGLYYQHHGSEYVTVAPPPQEAASMTALDYKGRRYYVQHGHYYSRTPGGEYVEISRPQGL